MEFPCGEREFLGKEDREKEDIFARLFSHVYFRNIDSIDKFLFILDKLKLFLFTLIDEMIKILCTYNLMQ